MKFFKKDILHEEKQWIDKETSVFEKFLPYLSHKIFLKIILLIIILVVIAKFFALFMTIIFSLITSYIKFKRQIMKLSIEIEPSYLFAAVLTLAFGFKFGFIYIIIPAIISGIMSGMISGGLLINMLSKIIVVSMIYFLPNYNPVLIGMIGVILTDLIGLKFRIKLKQPIDEVIMTLASNALLRYIYFSFFLGFIINLIR